MQLTSAALQCISINMNELFGLIFQKMDQATLSDWKKGDYLQQWRSLSLSLSSIVSHAAAATARLPPSAGRWPKTTRCAISSLRP
jgi:hypothetical protein